MSSFREIDDPRKVSEAVTVSLAVHAAIILLIAALSKLPLPSLNFSKTEFEKPVELSLIDYPFEPVHEPTTAESPPQFVQLPSRAGMNPEYEEDLPVHEIQPGARFEAARETRAGSLVPGQGDDPLPAQEGRRQQTLQIATNNHAAPLETVPPPAPRTGLSPDERQITEIKPPLPHLDELISTQMPAPAAPANEIMKQIEPAPSRTLLDAPPATPEREGDIALWDLPVRPGAVESFSRDLRLARAPQSRLLDEPVRMTAGSDETSGVSPTQLDGGIDEYGPAGVEAAATASAVYKQRIVDLISEKWQSAVKRRVGILQQGTVRVMFSVNKSGEIGDLRVVSNSSNPVAGIITLNAITSVRLPPIPDPVFESLANGKMRIDFFFTINE